MMQQYLAFDFRRDFECMATLKMLPISPFAAALAEVAVPTAIAYGYQALLVCLVAWLTEIPASLVVVALLVYPVLTLCTSAVNNIGFLLYPVRSVTAAGRPNMGGVPVNALLNMLVLMAAVVPAVLVGAFVFAFSASPGRALVAGLITQGLVDLAMILLLGMLFERFDVSKEPS